MDHRFIKIYDASAESFEEFLELQKTRYRRRKPTKLPRGVRRTKSGVHQVAIYFGGKYHYVGTFGHDLAAAEKVASDQESNIYIIFLKYAIKKRI